MTTSPSSPAHPATAEAPRDRFDVVDHEGLARSLSPGGVASGRHMLPVFAALRIRTGEYAARLRNSGSDRASEMAAEAEMLDLAWHCIKAEADRADRAEAKLAELRRLVA